MFSSLRLADGDLYVYDIERLGSAPDLVVLSACDSGFTETRPGEELMGLSSALLSMGTRSIIASVGWSRTRTPPRISWSLSIAGW
jgi:CHAT domain-containing protein